MNQANAINQFNLSAQSQAYMWQEMRDSANWQFQSAMNDADSKTRLAISAMSNEAATDAAKGESLVKAGELAWKIWDNWK